jgi:hypothetical protein
MTGTNGKLKFLDGWNPSKLGAWLRLLSYIDKRKYEISCQRDFWSYISR